MATKPCDKHMCHWHLLGVTPTVTLVCCCCGAMLDYAKAELRCPDGRKIEIGEETA